MENILFSLNTVAPIFILVALGAVLKKIKFANAEFFKICDKLGFKICLPCLLFMDIMDASFDQIDVKLILFCAGFGTFLFLASGLIVPLFLKKNEDRGAFIQGMCRSNAAILGVTIAANMFGQDGTVAMATVLPAVIALYNVYSVIILVIFGPQEVKLGRKELLIKVAKNIATNPLIIAVLLAVLWNLSGLVMPLAVGRSLEYLSELCVPLALLSLGASFSATELQEGAVKAIACSVCKTIVAPFLGIVIAWMLGIRGIGIGVVLIIFGGPAAISSYTMARQMKSNHILAGEIVLISTLMSAFTLFVGIFLLKTLRMI